MLLTLLVICQIAAAVANPFHKYPYVFLLDVGNEELKKTNTEQIRVSVPGGSIALRYPAIGNGDTIAHVRVSGLDFGTDLKANIVDGGPGFNYVVLAFMGNPGKPYDAVVTVQSVADSKSAYDTDIDNTNDSDGVNVVNTYQNNEEDRNDSAEDTSDLGSQYAERTNSELTQSSSNVYSYAANEVDSENQDDINDNQASDDEQTDNNNDYKEGGDEESNNEDDDYDEGASEAVIHKTSPQLIQDNENEKDIHKVSPELIENNEKVDVKDYADEIQSDTGNVQGENYAGNDDYDEQQQPIKVDRNLYKMYEALRPHLYDGAVVPIDAYDDQSEKTENRDDPIEIDQMFNDEEVHNDGKYRDSNNNFDSDDSSAVAY